MTTGHINVKLELIKAVDDGQWEVYTVMNDDPWQMVFRNPSREAAENFMERAHRKVESHNEKVLRTQDRQPI